jgi:hypothetical protein
MVGSGSIARLTIASRWGGHVAAAGAAEARGPVRIRHGDGFSLRRSAGAKRRRFPSLDSAPAD